MYFIQDFIDDFNPNLSIFVYNNYKDPNYDYKFDYIEYYKNNLCKLNMNKLFTNVL